MTNNNSFFAQVLSTLASRRGLAAAAAATALWLAAAPAGAAPNLVNNGSFEQPALSPSTQQQTYPAGSSAIPNWTIKGNSIDLINKFWTSADGAQSIDLDGNGPGSIEQNVPTASGTKYTVSFRYSSHPQLGSNPASMVVTVGTADQTFTFAGPSSKANMNWQTGIISFVAAGPTFLRFKSNDGPNQNFGMALDDVRVYTRAQQAALTVIATPSSVTYGNTATLSTTGGNGTGAASYSAGASTGCTLSGTTLSVTNASGTCSVTATKAGDVDYEATTSAPLTVALSRANQPTLSITGPASLGYGVPATITYTGGAGTGAVSFSAGTSTGCTVTGSTVTVSNSNGTCAITATKAADNNYTAATSAPFSPGLPQALATPVIFRAVNAADNVSAVIVGRVDGANTLPITVQAYTAAACINGVLTGTVSAAGNAAVTTDANGYFAGLFANVPNGSWVAIEVTTPAQTARSACIVSSADNDSWPKALRLVDTNLSARDYIDVPGRSRWYKFTILPGQRVTIDLRGLPADYDIAAFKDIGAAFLSLLAPANTAQLTKLSAEYAPAVFSPAVFSPAVFSPAVFSPDAYAPAVFSPAVFSPAVFSPAVFSPAVFSPAVFSPAVFSPAVFSPAVFSPAVFSPAVFSPAVFSPAVFSSLFGANGSPTQEFVSAFSSAQTRSIIGVSATPGTGDELVIVNTFNNTGDFYVRVVGRGGAYSTAGQFQLNVAKEGTSCSNVTLGNTARADNTSYTLKNTVILTDASIISPSAAKLDLLAANSRVNGIIVDVNLDQRVKDLKAQALANPTCPYAVNLVAEEIKRIVDSYRNANALRYVVIAGNDSVIPFFRYPDQSLLGQESGYVPPVGSNTISEGSLRNDMVLSQDAYGAGTQISVRTSNFPIPGLAVGRLVETPADMAGLIDAFIASPTTGLVPGTGLVSGYDFLSDAANAVATELTTGGVTVDGTLIAPNNISPQDPAAWKATDLGQKLLGTARNDVIFLAGHFSANSALAADFTTSLFTSQLDASTTNFTNAIVFSAGCHSGYNIADGDAILNLTQPLDWAQAFARKGATLIAGTGYQYGDTDFLEYSERIYANFARQLRAGSAGTAVSVGEALVKAKLDYLATTPDIRGIHEKALLEATLFGLPMLGVNMSGGRGATGGGAGAEAPVNVPVPPLLAPLGLKMVDKTIVPAFTGHTTDLKNVEYVAFDPLNPTPPAIVTATWYSGVNGVVTNPAEPVLPLQTYNIGAADPSLVVRGVGFRGGQFADSDIVPLTGAPTTELRGVHVPFVSPVFYPMRTWTVNYFGALGGSGGTNLLVTPAQHRAKDIALGTSTLRKFDNLDLRVFYSGNLTAPSTSDAPSIVRVNGVDTGGSIGFTAQVVGDPKAAIVAVWVTYVSDGVNKWQSLDLKQCVAPLPAPCTVEDSTTWKGTLTGVPPGIRFVVQAVNGFGLVTLDDNLGVYYGLGGAGQTATTTTFVSTPVNGTFGDTQMITVNLKDSTTNALIANKNVIVAIGGAARVATTDVSGNATVKVALASLPGTYRVIASFGGDTTYLASSATAGPISIAKVPTSFAGIDLASGVSTLTGKIGGKDQPLMQEAVTFVVSGNGYTRSFVVITDYLGRAPLPPTGLPAGTYTIAASFAGNATYLPVSTSQSFTILAQTITFGGGLATTMPFPGSQTFTVASTSGAPVTVTLVPSPSPFCTLAYNGVQYTVTATAPGTCTISATAAGTVTYADVTVTQDIAIKTMQTITFGALPDRTYGDADFALSASASSGLPVTFTSQTLPVCTVSGITVHIVSAGTCTIAADQAGNALYFAAGAVTRTLTVNKAAQTVTFGPAPPASATFGATFAVGASSTSPLPVTITPSGVCTVAGGTVTMTSGSGTCSLTASQAGDGNYLPASTSAIVNALPAAQTITFAQPTTPAAYNATFAVNATSTSGLAVSITPSGVCSIAGSTVTMTSGTGTCTLTASQSGNANYSAASNVVRTVDAAKAAQTIGAVTFSVSPPVTFATGGTFTVSATATSSLAVTFTPLTASVCTVAGTTVTMVTAGTCTIAANQGGNGNYLAAAQGSGSINIAKADQTISFTIGDQFLSPTPVTLNGTATSGLAASYTPTGNCTVSGNQLTLTAIGTCTVTASQAGNANYNAAPDVSQTFVIHLANKWTATNPMTAPRSYHTATRLLDGRVLITGGLDQFGAPTASTELYNPVTRTFASAGNMPSKSANHTAVLLNDGRVAVFGGGNSSSQIYTPANNTWASGGGLGSNRSYHTATTLPDGRVLIVGGADNAGKTFNSTIVYDPANGSSTAGPVLDTARERHTATLITTGPNRDKVLIVGGRAKGNGSNYTTHATYQFCTATACTGSQPGIAKRHSHTAVGITISASDIDVLVSGGSDGNNDLASSDVFDSLTSTWGGSVPAYTVARRELAGAELPFGQAIVAGGSLGNTRQSAADVYNAVPPTFVAAPPMGTARTGHTATSLRDANRKVIGVLVTGGVSTGGTSVNSAETYGMP